MREERGERRMGFSPIGEALTKTLNAVEDIESNIQ